MWSRRENSAVGAPVRRIGWVIGDQLERNQWLRRSDFSGGGSGLVRYQWVGEFINANPDLGLEYSLYRPWKRYDGLIFQKSMGDKSLKLLRDTQRRGKPAVFDANVNYYERWGEEYYEGMRATLAQENHARVITRAADAIIGDSPYITEICQRLNPHVAWIPDNVNMNLVPPYNRSKLSGRELPLLWSGQALKLFELLSIEKVLRAYKDKVKLVLVTNSLDALNRWRADIREQFEDLMRAVPHVFVPFESIEKLLQTYARGGVFISPRYMDNAYNMGHTEWKVALAMACGRLSLCSPVPSYVELAKRAGGVGIRVCESPDQWSGAFDSILGGGIDLENEERGARKVVEENYSTEVVARRHARFIGSVIDG